MSKMPKKIKVGGHTYTVREWDRRGARERNRWSETSHRDLTIDIDEDCPEPRRKEVLLHEVLHCVCNEWAIDTRDGEEKVVTAMALGLVAVMRDNPALLKWIAR